MSENQLWVAGGKIQNADAPFFILLNQEKYPITQISSLRFLVVGFQHGSLDKPSQHKLFLLPSVDPAGRLELINFMNR